MRKMDVLMQPLIIDRVFGFLSIFDIDRCQHVCQVWQKIALSILKKSPPFDYCHSVLKHQIWIPEAGNEDAERQLEEIIAENHRMNMEGITDPGPPWPSVIYWYMWRGPFSDLLPMSKVDQTIRGFLTSDAKCVPRFSILLYLEGLEEIFMNGIFFNNPTVIIRMKARYVRNGPVIREIGSKIKPLEIAHKKKFPGLSCQQEILSFNSYFEGLHINRDPPGVKIIITDWSDSQSARPDMNDPRFPVKSVLYFATSYDVYVSKMEEIEELLGNSLARPVSSGGVLGPLDAKMFNYLSKERASDGPHDESYKELITPKIFYVTHKSGEPKRSSIITLAFAGEKVKSAAHDIRSDINLDISNVDEQLEEFKRTLDFPTDDGRVVGFILERGYPDLFGCTDSSYSSRISSKIRDLFPSIKTLTITLNHMLNPLSKVMVTFHLIRV